MKAKYQRAFYEHAKTLKKMTREEYEAEESRVSSAAEDIRIASLGSLSAVIQGSLMVATLLAPTSVVEITEPPAL